MVSTSLEKNFQSESRVFQFVFWVLFSVLYVGLGSVRLGFVVRFNIVCGALSCWLWCGLRMLTSFAGKGISKEEDATPLTPSSAIVTGAYLTEAVRASS